MCTELAVLSISSPDSPQACVSVGMVVREAERGSSVFGLRAVEYHTCHLCVTLVKLICPLSLSFLMYVYNTEDIPWLVWLSGLSVSLSVKRLPVRLPVRAHPWVVGQVPS